MDLKRYDILLEGSVIACEQWDTSTGMAGYRWIAPCERGILLYQHAFGDYTQRWVHNRSRFFPHLLAKGFSVYGIDMPGCGHSPGSRGAINLSDATEYFLAARSILAESSVPVFLAGHSLGGLVVATSLIQDQANITGAILIAPALKYSYNRCMRMLAHIGSSIVPNRVLPLRNGPVDMLTRDPDQQQKLLNDPLLDAGGVTWITAKGTLALTSRNWKYYPQITVPMLALHGTWDTATDARGSVEFIDTVSSGDKTLRLIADGRHDLLNDFVGDEARDIVIEWLLERT